MNIAFTTDYFRPYIIGGAESSIEIAATSLARAGENVTILTPDHGIYNHRGWQNEEWGNEFAQDEVIAGERTFDWLGPVRIHRYWSPRTFNLQRGVMGIHFRNPAYYWYSAHIFAKIGRRLGFDVLHAQTAMVQIPTYWAARRLGIPCVATIRDMYSMCPFGSIDLAPCDRRRLCWSGGALTCARQALTGMPLKSKLKNAVDGICKYLDLRWRLRTLARYDKIVFPSKGYEEVYVKHGFPIPAERRTVIYNIPPDIERADTI